MQRCARQQRQAVLICLNVRVCVCVCMRACKLLKPDIWMVAVRMLGNTPGLCCGACLFLSFAGAVQTMEKLLKPDTRAAAVTMLGKTLDLCPEKVRLRLVSRCWARRWTCAQRRCALDWCRDTGQDAGPVPREGAP